ncbi:MAG: branched-chain amino acid ABC transporter permease [Thermoanaerobacteraceae bacterium]|nr:branched-chain amino acid ABC transporter permease [Thermoanaerobacteraceae bacterium]
MFISVIMSALLSGSIYGLIGLGYSLIYRASGIMNLSQGDLMCIGGFLGYTFYKMSGLSVLPSLILTIICTFILGCILERSVIRPIFNRSANTSVIILATIAVSYIIQSLEIIIWGAAPLAIPSYLKTQTVKLFGVTYQTESLLCIAVAIICMLAIHLFMKKTPFGIAMRAAAMDPEAARSCGINVEMTTRITWAISTTIAGIAGFMIGPIYGVSTTLGPSMSAKGFASAVVGGYGDMYGAILGGGVLAALESFSAGYISSTLKQLVAYVTVLIILVVKPRGLMNAESVKD